MTKKIEPFVKKVVITVDHDAPVYEAVKKMVDYDIGSVVIVDRTQGGKAVGIITKTSIFKALLRDSPPDGSRLVIEGKTCQDIMSSPLITVRSDTSYTEAMEKIRKHSIDHLVVVDDEGKPCGFLSVRDLFMMLNLEGFT